MTLFAATRWVLSPPGVERVSLTSSVVRVLSPPRVEGVLPSTSAQVHSQDQDRNKDMFRHMKNHYWARMHVCKAKMKILKRRLSRALKRRKRPDPLRILAKASLAGHDTWWRVFAPNLRKFGEIFVILKYFGLKTGFSVKRVVRPYAHFFSGHLLKEIFAFLDFSW